MGKPEECAGLLRRGLDPLLISAALGVSTQTAIDYLYRAMGKGYISTADIILSIPAQFRADVDASIEQLNTDYWYPISSALSHGNRSIDRDLLRLYLHIRGAVIGDCYYLVTAIEKALHALALSELGPGFTYRYFSDLVQAFEANPLLLSRLVATLDDPLPALQRANLLRNRIMHPIPPFVPSDDDFLFLRSLQSSVSAIHDAATQSERRHDQLALNSKLRAASEAAILRSPLREALNELLGDA